MSGPSVSWILQRRELIRFAWRRVLISATPEMRAKWADCARRLQREVDAHLATDDEEPLEGTRPRNAPGLASFDVR